MFIKQLRKRNMGKVISKTESNKLNSSTEYPKLMVGINTGVIVLFSWKSKGTVINIGNGTTGLSVGDYFYEWKMETFEDFHGSVILNNE